MTSKTDYRHYNRRTKRLLSLEMDYFCAYHKQATSKGIVTDVKYSGNSVYGRVYLKINEQWYVMVVDKYKPALKDLNKAILTLSNEPENLI